MQFLLVLAAHAQAQQVPLLDRKPFDVIILKEASGTASLEVLPLDVPERPLTSIPTAGSVKVRLVERPAQEFELSWSSVAEVRIFEQLLLDEARRLAAAGEFDQAYDYFARLLADHPSLPGLDAAVNDYLRQNALDLYRAKEHDRALAVLLTLSQRAPRYPGLPAAVESVAGEIIRRYLREGNHAAARSVLNLWQNEFRGIAAPAAAQWKSRFETAAKRQVDEAMRLVQQKQYISARKAVARAVAIWPTLESAATVAAQIQGEFPFVTVGVFEMPPRSPQRRIDCWAALRAARLTNRLLAEQIDFGAEGGVYRSPVAEMAIDETGRELSFHLAPDSTGGSGTSTRFSAGVLARYLLGMAQAEHSRFRPDYADLVVAIELDPPATVRLRLSRIHVRPESLLQVPPPRDDDQPPGGSFTIADVSPEQTIFAATAEASAAPRSLRAIVEQTLGDDEAAVTALLDGDVDILERVPPWQLERLRAAQNIQVASYRLPTVHVLIPNFDRPLLAKREFRRALCFGIDRQWIVERLLLAGTPIPGFEVLSGPFPAGTSLSDPVRYAYNNAISPRPFEPRLAAILATLAWSRVHAESNSEGKEKGPPLPEMPELILAHPNDPVARVACEAIQMQLQRQGISIKLRPFTADELLSGKLACDLRYAELAVWEPLADARRIMGPGSITEGLESQYLNVALRKLDEATNWNDVRLRLADLHEIAHHELPVIPLWQTINFFAYRSTIRGIGQLPVVLYQNVEQWTPAAPGDVARLERARP